LSAGSGVGLLGGIASVLVFEHKWPAPLAMGIALAIGILIWFCMGNLVVRQKMPAFIITLGGLLIFKGLFWLVIHNSTIPIVQGGRANLYSVLTTFYLPLIAGYALAALIVVALIVGKLRARKARQAYGFAVEDGEVVFLKLFLAAQLIFLFVVVTNKFRGIPFSAVILGVTAWGVLIWSRASGRRKQQQYQAVLSERARVGRELHDTASLRLRFTFSQRIPRSDAIFTRSAAMRKLRSFPAFLSKKSLLARSASWAPS